MEVQASGDAEKAFALFKRARTLWPDVLDMGSKWYIDALTEAFEDRKVQGATIGPVLNQFAATFQNPPAVSTSEALDFQKPNSGPTSALAFADPSKSNPSGGLSDQEIAAIVRGIQKIQVPPPILPEEATIGIWRLAPRDVTSERVLFGTEAGVATAAVTLTIGEHSLPYVKLIVGTGKTVIAAEEAADVYLIKQNGVYEKALRYLKDESRRKEFTGLVRALKEHRPIPESANIDMVRTAQAILDPKLGNSSVRIAWNAMLSPEAARAAMTQACIQLGGEILGAAGARAFEHVRAARSPAFREAEDFLEHAAVAIKKVSDPAAKESLRVAIEQANQVIASTYQAMAPTARGLESAISIYSSHTLEEARTERNLK